MSDHELIPSLPISITPSGAQAVIAGWGAIYLKQREARQLFLKKLNVTIIRIQDCRDIYSERRIHYSHLCAIPAKKDENISRVIIFMLTT